MWINFFREKEKNYLLHLTRFITFSIQFDIEKLQIAVNAQIALKFIRRNGHTFRVVFISYGCVN